MKAFSYLLVISLVGIALAENVDNFLNVQPRSPVDDVVKNLLKQLKEFLPELKIPDINESITNPLVNGSFVFTGTELFNLEKFENPVLDTSLLPLRIKNFTITWKEVGVSTSYDFKGSVDAQDLKGDVFGKGKGSIMLHNVCFTIGIRLKLDTKGVQIQPKGLENFDVSVKKVEVKLESLMGSEEIGQTVSVFLSNALPGLLDAVKKPLFDTFEDTIIEFLNGLIRGGFSESMPVKYIY